MNDNFNIFVQYLLLAIGGPLGIISEWMSAIHGVTRPEFAPLTAISLKVALWHFSSNLGEIWFAGGYFYGPVSFKYDALRSPRRKVGQISLYKIYWNLTLGIFRSKSCCMPMLCPISCAIVHAAAADSGFQLVIEALEPWSSASLLQTALSNAIPIVVPHSDLE